MVEKFRAKVCMELGDEGRARLHVAEGQRLEAAASGDAVERHAAAPRPGEAGRAPPAQPKAAAAPGPAAIPRDAFKELWSEEPAEERRLKQYSYVDEGPTVMLILDLNEHLGIGQEASAAVESLRQFRVQCEAHSADVQLRLRRADGRVRHFRLLLQPLAKEIVPEDTVPRLRGKESKRRLEVRLFKRDKQQTWFGDLVADSSRPGQLPTGTSTKGSSSVAPAGTAAKGTLLNPLTAEELARLPRPSGGSNSDNRPSSWPGQDASPQQQQPQQRPPQPQPEPRQQVQPQPQPRPEPRPELQAEQPAAVQQPVVEPPPLAEAPAATGLEDLD